MKHFVLVILFLLGSVLPATAQEPTKKAEKKQFLGVLRLSPNYWDEKNWTDKEMGVIGAHFKHLQELLKEGKLILAGRTTVENSKTMGLVVFEVESEEEARTLLFNDPAVKSKLMQAELFPYKVALLRQE